MTRRFGPIDFNSMSPVIKALLGINVAVFILQQLVGRELIYVFGLVPIRVTGELYVWQLFTYQFMHADFLHILFNMFVLWMFGTTVEREWGGREFLKFILICGVGAGLIDVALEPASRSPVIGASGMIYGLLVAFAMLFPDAVIYWFFLIPMKAKHMVMLTCVLEFMASSSGTDSKVARFAHLGGMAIAYVYIRWWSSFRIYAKAFLRELKERGTSRRPARPAAEAPAKDEAVDAEELDRILDKISREGEEKLSEAEREFLRKESKRKREGHA